MDAPTLKEEVVLFPLRSHDPDVKVLRVARVTEGQLDEGTVQHFAGGPYKGIIVSKATQDLPCCHTPEAVREFLVHVQDVKAGGDKETRERRKIFMWFKVDTENIKVEADKFFKNLIDPDHFPKDYISFVKKVILLARGFPSIQTLELEMSPAPEECTSPPVSPGYDKVFNASYMTKTGVMTSSQDGEQQINNNDINKKPHKTAPLPSPRVRVSIRDSQTDHNGSLESPTNADPLRRTQEDFRRIEDGQLSPTDNYLNGAYSGSALNADGTPRRLLRAENIREESMEQNGSEGTFPDPPPPLTEDLPLTADPSPTEDPPLSEAELSAKRQEILVVLEDAFPSALREDVIAGMVDITSIQTSLILQSFKDKSLAQQLDNSQWIRVSTIRRKRKSDQQSGGYTGRSSYARASTLKHDFQVVPQMPILDDKDQPSVAVITLLFCEKQAIDAMMDNKTTYVRYKTEGSGENQVYTVGVIGSHKVVSTKLSRIGRGQGATVSAGNSVTRLLGTFGKIEHVFLVGVAGSIPNFEDDSRHIRCGDVVISRPEFSGAPTYVHVTDVASDDSGGINFGTQFWEPKSETVTNIVANLAHGYGPHSMTNTALAQNIQSGLADLGGQELSFSRPPSDADRLYKVDSDGAWEEVPHPDSAPSSPRHMYPERPIIHFGSIGAGYDQLVKAANDWRQEFALFNDIKALDSGYQAVMESIDGNRTESFWLLRGIADYADGMTGTEWQPYASLVAAAAAKMILSRLPSVRSERRW